MAAPGRQNGQQSQKRSVLHGRHSGSRAMVVMGVFPSPSKVPPKRNRKPRLTPRVRGFTYETLTSEDTYDWQSYARFRSLYRFRNHLLSSACKCGPVRWTLAHGRRDYQRPLRRNPHRRWNKPWPNLFYWRKLFRSRFRSLPNSIGRACLRRGAGQDECSGWPAQRQWDRTV